VHQLVDKRNSDSKIIGFGFAHAHIHMHRYTSKFISTYVHRYSMCMFNVSLCCVQKCGAALDPIDRTKPLLTPNPK
jgi:hypothetical protein